MILKIIIILFYFLYFMSYNDLLRTHSVFFVSAYSSEDTYEIKISNGTFIVACDDAERQNFPAPLK